MGITTVGFNTIRSLTGSPQPSIPTYMVIGSGTTAFSDSDTELEKENNRNNLTSYGFGTPKVVTYIGDFSSTDISGTDVSEFGVINAATNGSLFQRQAIDNLSFVGDRELQVQVSFRYSGA